MQRKDEEVRAVRSIMESGALPPFCGFLKNPGCASKKGVSDSRPSQRTWGRSVYHVDEERELPEGFPKRTTVGGLLKMGRKIPGGPGNSKDVMTSASNENMAGSLGVEELPDEGIYWLSMGIVWGGTKFRGEKG